MVNYARKPSRRRERQRRHAPSMQDTPSLMELLYKEIQKYPLIPTSINVVIIQPEM